MPTSNLCVRRIEILLYFTVAIVLNDIIHGHANVVTTEDSCLDLWICSNILRVGLVGYERACDSWIASGTVCTVAKVLFPAHSTVIEVLGEVTVLV